MKVREVFKQPIERHIAPVVYFHEQTPERLADEVREYIFTPGIHDQMVGLLRNLAAALADPSTCDHPAAWISGFFGSGKSSFAKLVGLGLGGRTQADGSLLADRLVARDDTKHAADLKTAWGDVRTRLPKGALSVVFDIGAEARDNEQVDKVALRCLRHALGYCRHDPVALDEMKLERDGRWEEFQQAAVDVLGRPWSEAAADAFAMEDFSEVMHRMFPSRYVDPMAWHYSHTGRAYDARGSVQDGIDELRHLLDGRGKGRHVFFVIDEVSQYIVRPTVAVDAVSDGDAPQDPKDRMLRLQSFISALGQSFRGRVWLFAIGQEQLDQAENDSPLWKLRARFPDRFRVHLDAANIRDVVKRRLLRKNDAGDREIRACWATHGAHLRNRGWHGEHLKEEHEFVDTYPLLPGHVELLLGITQGIRERSPRMQADATSVRGLIQLVQELFRVREGLGDDDVPTLLTLDRVYEVQRSALPNDQIVALQQVFVSYPEDESDQNALLHRVIKAVVMLGYQTAKVTEQAVARSLLRQPVDDLDEDDIRACLEMLRDANLLTFSDSRGYQLQDAAGQEWEAERRRQSAGADKVVDLVSQRVAELFTVRASLGARQLPLEVLFTGGSKVEHRVVARRDETTVPLDLRFVPDAGDTASWLRRSNDAPLNDRFVWVVPFQPGDGVFNLAQDLEKSQAMVRHYNAIKATLGPERLRLFVDETTRVEKLVEALDKALRSSLMRANVYFRGQRTALQGHSSVEAVVRAVIEPRLRDLYPYFKDLAITQRDMDQLLAQEVPAGASQKFFDGRDGLGLLRMDAGQPVWAPDGEAPKAIFRHIEEQRGCNAGTLLQAFARPPYGYAGDVVRACILALFRGERIEITSDAGRRFTSLKDEGARDLFGGDRALRGAELAVRSAGKIGPRELVAIRRVLALAGENVTSAQDRDRLTDAIFRAVSAQLKRSREVDERLRRIPVVGESVRPEVLVRFSAAAERCVRDRSVEPTLEAFHKDLSTFEEAFPLLKTLSDKLTDDAIQAVREAADALRELGAQLRDVEASDPDVLAALEALTVHLSTSRPWLDFGDLAPHVSRVQSAYRDARAARSAAREEAAKALREQIKREPGFERLTTEQADEVLEPLVTAGSSVDVDAMAPVLRVLDQELGERLSTAEQTCRERLHRILHPATPVHEVRVQTKVLKSADEIDSYVEALRERLLAEIHAGRRHVRVVGG